MKITKERLIEIIKEELEAIQENEYGSSLVMGKMVPSEKRQELIDDLKAIDREDVINRLGSLYQMNINLGKIHAMAKAKDMEGLNKAIGVAKKYGDRVARS